MGQCKDCQWYDGKHEDCKNQQSDEFTSLWVPPDGACRFFQVKVEVNCADCLHLISNNGLAVCETEKKVVAQDNIYKPRNCNAYEFLTPPTDEAVKHDEGKLSMSMIPIQSIERLAEVYMVGAAKYTRDNWRKGMQWHRIYDAVQRHLMAFWKGENADKEDNISHLAHAAWGMFTLMEYQRTGAGEDDRNA